MFNIILPTYNEAENIPIVINMLIDIFKETEAKYSIIIVDDNSTDGTAEIVEKIIHDNVRDIKYDKDMKDDIKDDMKDDKKNDMKNDKDIKYDMKDNINNKNNSVKKIVLIKRSGKLGLGSAYAAAIPYCFYDRTIILDSDLQHNPFDIIEMAKYKDFDVVTGTRYTSYEMDNSSVKIKYGCVCGWSFKRKLISSFANTLARFILDLKTTDLTGSFRIYKTELLKKIVQKMKSKGFGVQMEIIARAEYMGANIKEVPITFYDRSAGSSKMGALEIFRFLIVLIQLYILI